MAESSSSSGSASIDDNQLLTYTATNKVSSLFDLAHLKREFFAGGLAGSIGIFIGFPFDLIKVNLQVYPDKFKNARECFRHMLKEEGLRGLYRGCIPPIVSQGVINSLLFVGESTMMRFLEPDLKKGEMGSVLNTVIAGCSGGILQCVALVPSDVVKCTMQAQESSVTSASAASRPSAFQQTFSVIKHIYRTEGFLGFYKGLGVTALREAPSIGIYFFSYKSSRDVITKMQGRKEPSTSAILLSGGLAGALSWTIVYPFDVIKTYMQIAGSADSGSKITKDSSILQVGRELYRRHGMTAFFRGLGATVLRAFPVNASTFFFYEKIKDKFHFE